MAVIAICIAEALLYALFILLIPFFQSISNPPIPSGPTWRERKMQRAYGKTSKGREKLWIIPIYS